MKIIPEIPIKVQKKFPDGFQNTFPYWGFFSQEQLEANRMKRCMQGTNPALTPRDLIYLEIHKPLEKDHDRQSTRMVDLVRKYVKTKDGYDEEEFRGNMILKVRGMCKSFANFWSAMNMLVFKELTREPPV